MMRLPPFAWHAPDSIKEATRILDGEGPSAVLLAGGTDLLPNLKRRQISPRTVVSLRGLRALRGIHRTADGVTLGAGTTLTEVARHEEVRSSFPALVRAVARISTPILRNMGTIGGNLCLDTRCNFYDQGAEWRAALGHCMKAEGTICQVAPSSRTCLAVNSSDGAAILCALGARVALCSTRGERELELEQLYAKDGIHHLTLEAGEILTEVRLPRRVGWMASYRKLALRGAFDFPLVGLAVAAPRDGGDNNGGDGGKHNGEATGAPVLDARVILNAVASAPLRAREAEAALIGRPLSTTSIREAADLASLPGKPMDNTDQGPIWRKQMIRVQAARALCDLMN